MKRLRLKPKWHPKDTTEVLAVIPARYASTRFPGKPLATIAGRAMIQHVVARVRQARAVSRIVVATEDDANQEGGGILRRGSDA